MLQHQMKVLHGVKEYSDLFKKELYKTMIWLTESELQQFYKWLIRNFYTQYGELIEDAFSKEHLQMLT